MKIQGVAIKEGVKSTFIVGGGRHQTSVQPNILGKGMSPPLPPSENDHNGENHYLPIMICHSQRLNYHTIEFWYKLGLLPKFNLPNCFWKLNLLVSIWEFNPTFFACRFPRSPFSVIFVLQTVRSSFSNTCIREWLPEFLHDICFLSQIRRSRLILSRLTLIK